jgi:hypothetical protein
MRTETIYPYWEMLHDELIDIVSLLTEHQIEETPHPESKSLRQIIVGFAAHERFQIGHLVGGNRYDRPFTAEYATGAELTDLLTATREITDRVLGPLNPASLRSVRTLPADTETNRPETNVTVAWLIWDVLQHEVRCLGKIQQRFDDQGWRRARKKSHSATNGVHS